jgi:TRAP-type mannitol/chloroaromatic compound transport system permease small subunit
MRRLFGAIDALNEWTGRIVGFQIVFIVGVVVYEVVMRSVFVRPTLWANETMVYVTAMAYLLGGGYTLLHRRHVIVDVIYQRLLPRTRARLDLLTFLFFVIYMLTLIWVGWSFAWDSVQQRETAGTPWNPPIYPVKLAIPLAGLLVLLQGLANVVRDFYAARGETRP